MDRMYASENLTLLYLLTIYNLVCCGLIDFGVDELIEFNNATNFPWLLSNVFDLTAKEQLAEGEVKKITEWGGRKVGHLVQYVCTFESFTFKIVTT